MWPERFPKLNRDSIEPDVVIEWNNIILIVEAKFISATDPEELLREFLVGKTETYPRQKAYLLLIDENLSPPAVIDSILGQPIELIEIKRKLNRPVIGQVIAGAEMFKKDYQSGKINRIVLCNEGDSALEWVCKQRDIEVKIIRMNYATP